MSKQQQQQAQREQRGPHRHGHHGHQDRYEQQNAQDKQVNQGPHSHREHHPHRGHHPPHTHFARHGHHAQHAQQDKHPRFKDAYDVIVVGSGVGGLTAALELANSGKDVLVLEQHNLTGGYSSSFVRGRYEFEVSLHELCECGDGTNGATFGGVRTILDSVGVFAEYVRVPDAYRVILSKWGVDFTMPFGIENAIAAIEAVDPGQGPKVRNLFALCGEIYDALMYIQSCDMNPSPLVMATKHSSFLRTAAYSVEDVYNALGFSPLTKDLLSAYYGYVTRRLDETSFTVWALMLYLYIRDGAHIINKTSHALAIDMEMRLRELGAQVETNVAVTRLLVEDGAVTGVETSLGEQIRAKRVLCNLSPNTVFARMMPAGSVPEEALRLTGARTLGASPFGVYLGLDALPEEMGITSYEFFFSEDMNTARIYELSKRWQISTKISVTCPDVAIPGLTGPDRCQMNFTCLYDPEAMIGHTGAGGYQTNKEEFADGLIAIFESITGARIRSHIEEIEIATPATYVHYSGTPFGNIYGYEMTVLDGIVPRTLRIHDEQYVPGLDFVGGFGRRAHGFCSSITNGYDTARDTLKILGGE
ncbi:MAG: NAD(P)/FAD-dependent oxidoreductase [Coriobacteriales bacterium]|nr:NAD(P)/FAD-dependent oxidoreductase [Coriobacteriales bacterium]